MGDRSERRASGGRSPVDRAGHEVLRQIAEADASAVLAAARSAAAERARTILEDVLVEELLGAAGRHPRPASDDPAAPGDGSASAWWAYCVIRAERAGAVAAELSGVEPGSPVESVSEGGLAVLVSRVPLPDYGDDQLREHLEDLAWLERTARAHEAVQEKVLRHGALVPLRLCTIFHNLDRVRQALREHAEVLSRNLNGLEGAQEWGVKVFLDPRSVAVAGTPKLAKKGHESGAAYLAGRQREREQVAQADEFCLRCTEEVRRAVRAISIEERVNPGQRPEAHGRDAEMILNGAYLVADDRVADLRATVAELRPCWAEQGLLVELTGPWPPYNFVSESAGMLS